MRKRMCACVYVCARTRATFLGAHVHKRLHACIHGRSLARGRGGQRQHQVLCRHSPRKKLVCKFQRKPEQEAPPTAWACEEEVQGQPSDPESLLVAATSVPDTTGSLALQRVPGRAALPLLGFLVVQHCPYRHVDSWPCSTTPAWTPGPQCQPSGSAKCT